VIQHSFDFVVVGGGSSGCVVTRRLVDAGKRVLLLECGPADNHPFIHIPATFVRMIGSKRSFMYRAEQDPGVGGRSLAIPQGRTLGGGSAINAMIYIRGQAQDYDQWRDLGCTGWGHDDVLPYFRRSEGNERLANELHGTEGPLKVSDLSYTHPLSRAFVRAAQQCGIPHNSDFNGATQNGAGLFQTTTFSGRRGSAAVTYLNPVKGSSLLTVMTGCEVVRISLKDGRAHSVVFRRANGVEQEAIARQEIVLAAGALATPKLLMLSGIGPGGHLQSMGIPVQCELPGVGANFQDHISAPVYGVTDKPISLLHADKGIAAMRHGLQYMLTRSGLLTSNVVESGAFVDTSGSGRPDVQIHVTPALVGDAERKPMNRHGITINPCVLRPVSRGRVQLRSPNAADPATCIANNLSAPEDMETLLRGIALCRRILRAPALRALGFTELAPGESESLSIDELRTHAKAVAKTVYHPSGTCKMGVDDMAVVDPQLRVKGVADLRITDASIMPTLVSGNTNAPTIMIAEKCADMLLA
jgi:choline dehydrogenase-like flavoprotein